MLEVFCLFVGVVVFVGLVGGGLVVGLFVGFWGFFCFGVLFGFLFGGFGWVLV